MIDNALQSIKSYFPDFKSIEVYPIYNVYKHIVGWDAVAYSINMYPISGGTHINQNTAIQICIAELLERTYFIKLTSSSEKNDYLIDEYPTTCGFAFGFNSEKTKSRSICEALERWTWTKWIDNHCEMKNAGKIMSLDKLSEHIVSFFSSYECYEKNFKLNGIDLKVSIFLGLTDEGIFAGSRACHISEDPWSHAIIEAYRNFRNSTLQNTTNRSFSSSFIRNRVMYFAKNKESAIVQIKNAIKKEWPQPSIRIVKQVNFLDKGQFLWRTILNDYKSWHLGDEKRFVY